MEHIIQDILLRIGMQPNLLGFSYIVYIEQFLLEHQNHSRYLIKELYQITAENFHTTPAAVERCIRHAISVTWSSTTLEESKTIQKLFANNTKNSKDVPTNSQLIFRIYLHLLKQTKYHNLSF